MGPRAKGLTAHDSPAQPLIREGRFNEPDFVLRSASAFAGAFGCLSSSCLLPGRSQVKQSMMRLFLAALILAAGAPAMAGAGVGQSIWKQGQAYQRAIKNKPADAKVTSSHCHANYSSGENTVYTCTVIWD